MHAPLAGHTHAQPRLVWVWEHHSDIGPWLLQSTGQLPRPGTPRDHRGGPGHFRSGVHSTPWTLEQGHYCTSRIGLKLNQGPEDHQKLPPTRLGDSSPGSGGHRSLQFRVPETRWKIGEGRSFQIELDSTASLRHCPGLQETTLLVRRRPTWPPGRFTQA